ncbi:MULTISPECIES: hypothetical protein [Streptomyces]|uniref:Lipoprotein n=1 Tax=Streptomyces lonegramiae TaxID=3075524 RepID=A0ABU2XBK0_9ACTN|nr:hypothetical protein [Streptomyces sp. DSM 41529]MDT0543292.1 hypothetical protein [Streptomyces sp. DSM 41529]
MVRKQFPFASTLVVVATLASISACGSSGGGGSSAGDAKGGAAIGKGMAELPVEPTESPTPTEDPTEDPTDTPTGGGGLVSPDIKMGNCGWGSTGIPYANVKITNSDSTTSYYTLMVGFVDSKGEVVTTAFESDAEVAGNASKTVKVVALEADSSKKATKCRVSLGTKSKTAA